MATPFDIILAQHDVPVKRRPEPVANTLYKLMFDRIEMNVINATFEIQCITTRACKHTHYLTHQNNHTKSEPAKREPK